MNDPADEHLLRERSLAFFGAITASVSHELNNVISILDQSAGLLGDLTAGSRAGRPIPEEKLEKISDTMQRQTQRGLGIIRRLNRFAHSVDLPDCEFDLGETVASLGTLCIRLADMKSTTVSMPAAETPIIVSGSPFLVQQWLFLTFRQMLSGAQKGDTIEMSAAADSAGATVTIRGPIISVVTDDLDADSERLLLECMNARTSSESDDGLLTVRLHLPRRIG